MRFANKKAAKKFTEKHGKDAAAGGGGMRPPGQPPSQTIERPPPGVTPFPAPRPSVTPPTSAPQPAVNPFPKPTPSVNPKNTKAEMFKKRIQEYQGPGKRVDKAEMFKKHVAGRGMKKGGAVKSSASKRADGCAVRGKTRA